jgi:tRNA pseudouridine55 synthase
LIHGIINVYKESGYTSHDVVAKLRGILKQRKIGHTGTLDPQAKGVLPVCFGNATKISDMLTNKSKTYETVCLLGTVTETQDIYGKVLSVNKVNLSSEKIVQVVQSFIGEYDQLPPMYSAIKIDGRKLYELAREGKEIERKTRKVGIHNIQILDINMDTNEIKMVVDCSKGTYIRTLIHDIGKELGCGACMKDLIRTRVGEFHIKESFSLDEIDKIAKNDSINRIVTRVETMFPEYEKIVVAEEFSKLIYNGNMFHWNHVVKPEPWKISQQVRVYDWKNQFIGIYQYDNCKEAFKPVKMFL